jgi:NAD-dependent SIR2 family protein deacetylase
MSTFSTVGGLYERAQKRFKVSDGKKLFTWQFFEKRRLEVQAFFGDIYVEAQRATPGLGHYALGRLALMGKLLRHYTLNIDGLAGVAGLSVWHPETDASGAYPWPSGPHSHLVFDLTACLVALHMLGHLTL